MHINRQIIARPLMTALLAVVRVVFLLGHGSTLRAAVAAWIFPRGLRVARIVDDVGSVGVIATHVLTVVISVLGFQG